VFEFLRICVCLCALPGTTPSVVTGAAPRLGCKRSGRPSRRLKRPIYLWCSGVRATSEDSMGGGDFVPARKGGRRQQVERARDFMFTFVHGSFFCFNLFLLFDSSMTPPPLCNKGEPNEVHNSNTTLRDLTYFLASILRCFIWHGSTSRQLLFYIIF
jgi:hypothetical protein